jgi:hypothetical protein
MREYEENLKKATPEELRLAWYLQKCSLGYEGEGDPAPVYLRQARQMNVDNTVVVYPESIKGALSDLTDRELARERLYWLNRVTGVTGWGATLGAASGFLKACDREIERRAKS